MSLGFAFALLLTLQSLQLVSTQTSNQLNEEVTSSPPNKGGMSEEPGMTSGSMSFSGDGENQAAATGQYDNMNTTTTPETIFNVSNSTETNTTAIQHNNTDPIEEPSVTNDNNVNLTETNSTTPSPGNSTTTTTTTTTIPAFINTVNSTSTVNENLTTTSPPQVANHTEPPSETPTNTTVLTTTTMHDNTTVLFTESMTTINATGGNYDAKEHMDKGMASDVQQQNKIQAWGAILGIGIGVAIVGLVIYIIVKRRNYRHFSHRKLVEDMPPEPVLRLDNSEPLDLKFNGFAYYNPGLQRDNIQMTNFPQGHTN